MCVHTGCGAAQFHHSSVDVEPSGGLGYANTQDFYVSWMPDEKRIKSAQNRFRGMGSRAQKQNKDSGLLSKERGKLHCDGISYFTATLKTTVVHATFKQDRKLQNTLH